jgi:hypothetical protein
MAGMDETHTKPPKEPTQEGERFSPPKSETVSHPNLVAFTVDADAGRIVRVEKVDSTGVRRDLSNEDAASLTNRNTITLERIIEQAFEAGIACMLGDEAAEDEALESEDDALSRLLLMPLMERTRARGLLRREVLGRAILASAVEQAASYRSDRETAPQQEEGAMAKPRPSTRPGPAQES